MYKLSDYKFNYAILIAGHYENNSNLSSIDNLISSNISISTKIIEQIKSNINKVIYLSTFSYIGKNGSYEPINLYSATKKNFEDILYYYFSKYNFSLNIVYLYETYYEFDTRDKFFNIIKSKIINKESINLTSKNLKLNFIHFKDLSDAICSLLKIDKKKRLSRFSIRGQEITLNNLIKLIVKHSSYHVSYNYDANLKYNSKKRLFYFKRPPGWSPKIKLETFIKNFIS